MTLGSDTRKPAEAASITEEEGLSGGNHVKISKMRRAREDIILTPVTEDRDGYFQLTTDIVWEVLLRVSIETLMACRCVCKTWYNMTKNPGFINAQMMISSKRPPRIICSTDTSVSFRFLDNLLLCDIEQGRTRNMPLKESEFHYRSSRIIFSNNGLLCYAPINFESRQPVVICNPITKECIELPQLDGVNYIMTPLVGFCFVPAKQIYIVVQLSMTLNAEGDKVVRFHILTSGQSSWRLLTNCPCIINPFFKGKMVYSNNTFHCQFGKGGFANEFILSFDTVHETFQVTPCPDATDIPQPWLYLLVLSGRLNLIEHHGNKMKLWEMMGDRAGDFSLVCREIYDMNDRISFSLHSRLYKNELLLRRLQRGSFAGFVVASNDMKQFKTVPIDGLPPFFTVHAYHPSLVSVSSMDLPRYHRGS